MSRPVKFSDFVGREIAGGRCLTRLAPSAAPSTTAAARTFTFVFSNGEIDRYGDKIDPNGWDLTNYKTNPVVLFGHDAGTAENVVGRAKNVRVTGGQLLGDVEFMPADVNPLAETVCQMVKGGFLNAVSVGFAPIAYKAANDKSRPGGIDFSKVELLEVSIVPIPALPSALIQARAAGIDARPVAAWAESQLASKDPAMPRSVLEIVKRDFSSPPVGRAAYDARDPSPHSPFQTLGKFLQAVYAASVYGAKADAKLIRAPHGANETDPTAGGFLVPPQFEKELIGSIYEDANLAQLCDRRETDKPNNWKLPAINETSRADGSRWGGALSYWMSEADQPSGSYPRYARLEFSAKRLIALSIASNELIADAPLLEGHVRRAFASEAAFKLDLAILRGTGAGTPLGIVSAPGTIQVAKANGQAAGTIIAENVASMWSRLAAPCRKRAIWIVNEDAESQLELLGSASAAGMYFPAGTGGNPFPLLKGRPVIAIEQAPTLGTPGDIVLADLSQYILIDGGMQTAMSMDVNFDTDEGVFRFRWRGHGMPAWSTPITPFNGGATRAAFVTLAQR